MSTLPRDVRISTIHEIGVKIDDYLDVAKSETFKREGAQAAYVNAAKHLINIFNSLEKELQNPAHAPAVPFAKFWVQKCLLTCEDLAKQASNQTAAAKGAERQTSNIVALLKQFHDLEVVKKQRETEVLPKVEPVQKAVAVEAAPPAPPAVVEEAQRPRRIPKRTIKEQRLAEAAEAERKAAEAKAAEEAAASAKPAKKGKGRRRAGNA